MKTHIVYFDILRVLSIFAVVVLHVAGDLFFNNHPNSFSWEMANMYNGLTRWSVPVFVMISGALFLNPKRNVSLPQIYSKNIFHLAFILVLWSLFYTVLNFALNPSGRNPLNLIEGLVLGEFHLWFLYMLLGLYILVPLLRPICEKDILMRYFLILSFVFSFLPSFIFMVEIGLNLAFPHPIFSESFKILKTLLEKKINFHFALGYTSYFVLGYYVYKNTLSPITRKILYVLGLAGCIAPILFGQFISQKAIFIFDFYTESNTSLPILFTSLAIFVFAKQHWYSATPKLTKFFHYISKRVLGIYLIHVAILNSFSHFFDPFHTHITPLISIPLVALIIFIISLLLTDILRRITFINKYIF